MPKDSLISIDMRTFDKSIDKIVENLSKLEKEVDVDIGRLTFFAGNIVVDEMKRNHTFKNVTGTLQRSFHTAPGNASHKKDEVKAEKGVDLQGTRKEVATLHGKNQYLVQVGSWLEYSYPVERTQPYLLPAFEKKFEEVVKFIAVGLKNILDARKI